MVDLKKIRKLYKIMWLPGEKEILFQLKNEEAVISSSTLYQSLNSYIDINKWNELYSKVYQNWLENDESSIYDINNDINSKII